MKKIILSFFMILSLVSLTCCEKDDFDASLEPPLSKEILTMAVPDFLTEEQQLLYRRAYSLYQHMFGGETSAIEYGEFSSQLGTTSQEHETIQIGSFSYTKSLGRYKDFFDFEKLIDSVFSARFWDERNIIDKEVGTEIYIEKDKSLYFIEFSRGSGYFYNKNFPDKFELLEKKDTLISFNVIGHYSQVWPYENETSLMRNERRKTSYDYVIEFPITLVLTDEGWRFDKFYTALADEKPFEEVYPY